MSECLSERVNNITEIYCTNVQQYVTNIYLYVLGEQAITINVAVVYMALGLNDFYGGKFITQTFGRGGP